MTPRAPPLQLWVGITVHDYITDNGLQPNQMRDKGSYHISDADAYCVVGCPHRHLQYLCVYAASSDPCVQRNSRTYTRIHASVDGD